MRRRLAHALVTVFLFAASSLATAAGGETPIGRWQTFDDHTNAPRGIVRIFEQDGRLFGRVERGDEQKKDHAVCTVCPDDRKDQPIDGLVIIRNLAHSPDDPLEWSGGDILDPDTGKIYRVKVHVEDHGARLVVRGFLGVSLLGRTQTWKRLS